MEKLHFFYRSKCTTLIVSQSYFNKKKIVMNNLSSNLNQDILNNKLKRRLSSKAKLRGYMQHITIGTHVMFQSAQPVKSLMVV